MIEIHYGKYIRNDADEQTKPEVGDKTETSGETVERKGGRRETQATEKIQKMLVGPPGLEPARAKNSDDQKTQYVLDSVALSSQMGR
jgi:hypothetical protein